MKEKLSVQVSAFQLRQLWLVITIQALLSVFRTLWSVYYVGAQQPTSWIYLLNLIFYVALQKTIELPSIQQEAGTFVCVVSAMIINFTGINSFKDDPIFLVALGLQLVSHGTLLHTQRSQLTYYSIVYCYIFVREELWNRSGIYFVSVCIANIIGTENLASREKKFLKSKIQSKSEKFASFIRILHRHLEYPVCILYQSQKNKSIKALLLTRRFQQDYIRLEENVNPNPQYLQLLEAQHSAMFARIVDEHFPQLQSSLSKPLDSNLQPFKKDSSVEPQIRRLSHSEAIFRSFQRYQSEKGISVVQDLESVVNSPQNQDGKHFIAKTFKSPYSIPKNTTTKSPTRKKKDSLAESRGYMDVIFEVQQENQKNEAEMNEYEELEPFECLWNTKKCLFLISQSEKNKIGQLTSKLAQLEQQLQYRDDLLATVSHDFKTPLNGMILILEYLESNCHDEKLIYYFQIIKKNAFLLLYMINDIIDFSKISQNQISICPQNFQLDEIINEVVELLNLQAKQKGVDLRYQNNLTHDDMFNDPNRVKQIIMNLLSNALKFTNQGQITVIVDEPSGKEKFSDQISGSIKNTIKITVRDTGVGIPEDIKPKLFNMYATFDHNNGSNKHGAGLGLVICKKLVGLLGPSDSIDLESQEGKGASFSFLLYIYLQQDKVRSLNSLTVRDIRFNSVYPKEEHSSISRKGASRIQSGSHQPQQQQPSLKNVQNEFTSRRHNQSVFKKMNSPNRFGRLSEEFLVNQEPETNEDHAQEKANHIQYLENLRPMFFSKNPFQNGRFLKPNIKLETIPSIQGQVDVLEQVSGLNKNRFSEDCLFQLLGNEDDQNISILIVDDEVFNVMALKLQLNYFHQIEIDEAYNGKQAIEMIAQKKSKGEYYRCIFMDLTMGIMDGYQAGKLIRQQITQGDIEECYLIALSGHDDEKEKDRCLTIGFHGFLSKPIRIPEILGLLDNLNCMRQLNI